MLRRFSSAGCFSEDWIFLNFLEPFGSFRILSVGNFSLRGTWTPEEDPPVGLHLPEPNHLRQLESYNYWDRFDLGDWGRKMDREGHLVSLEDIEGAPQAMAPKRRQTVVDE